MDNVEKLLRHLAEHERLVEEVEDAEDANIIWGQYTEDEAHDILKWINRIKSMQITLLHRLDELDAMPTKQILDSSWRREVERMRSGEEEAEAKRFEKQYITELLKGGMTYEDGEEV